MLVILHPGKPQIRNLQIINECLGEERMITYPKGIHDRFGNGG